VGKGEKKRKKGTSSKRGWKQLVHLSCVNPRKGKRERRTFLYLNNNPFETKRGRRGGRSGDH